MHTIGFINEIHSLSCQWESEVTEYLLLNTLLGTQLQLKRQLNIWVKRKKDRKTPNFLWSHHISELVPSNVPPWTTFLEDNNAQQNYVQHRTKMTCWTDQEAADILSTQMTGMSAQTQVGTVFPVNNSHSINSFPAYSQDNHSQFLCRVLSTLKRPFRPQLLSNRQLKLLI